MIRSMTGFGSAERDTAAGRLRVEVRTVNHRFFSPQVRVASALERYEPLVREWLRAYLPRGHVTCSLRLVVDGASDTAPPVRLDLGRARAYHRVLEELKQAIGLPGDVDVALLSRFGDLLVPAEPEVVELAEEEVKAVTEAAARAVATMREDEGRRLLADLEERLRGIEVALDVISERAPRRLEAERDRLRAAIVDLLGDVGVDEDRIAREVAFMAERWDVSEELVRLASHISLFREMVGSDPVEPVGKRLGFLVQEMHREANTIGSKANDALIEHQVIAIKDEIERLREQVENVE